MRGGRKPRNAARRLRANPTEAEKRLWLALRPLRQTHGLHFRRQTPVGPYIVDFAFLSRKLIVEVDGGQHAEGADTARDAWLTAQGYCVLRFWNNDVSENLEGVLETILAACGASDDRSSPLPVLHGEGSGVGPPKAVRAAAIDEKERAARAPHPNPPRKRGGDAVGKMIQSFFIAAKGEERS